MTHVEESGIRRHPERLFLKSIEFEKHKPPFLPLSLEPKELAETNGDRVRQGKGAPATGSSSWPMDRLGFRRPATRSEQSKPWGMPVPGEAGKQRQTHKLNDLVGRAERGVEIIRKESRRHTDHQRQHPARQEKQQWGKDR